MPILIICKPELHISSTSKLENKLQGKHTDYFQLYYIIKILNESKLNFHFCTWADLNKNLKNKFDLVIIPQQMFLAGQLVNGVKHIVYQLEQIMNSGAHLLFLHHFSEEFINEKVLNIKSLKYLSSKIKSYIINNIDSALVSNLHNLNSVEQSTNEEFSYVEQSHSKFVPILYKVPIDEQHQKQKFICFGYELYKKNRYKFLIDIHGTGSKKKDNGRLFSILFKNVLNFIEVNTELLEELEIKRIESADLPETVKQSLIESRIGQGKFKNDLIKYWNTCSLTGSAMVGLLKASHIKPWRVSNNQERLDVYNGLLLTPNLDTCFDKGFISFEDDGQIIISNELKDDDLHIMGIKRTYKLKTTSAHFKYLEYHREFIFEKWKKEQ